MPVSHCRIFAPFTVPFYPKPLGLSLCSNDHPDSLCAAFSEDKACAGRQILWSLQEAEADAGPVTWPQAFTVHRHHPRCLPHDLAVDHCLCNTHITFHTLVFNVILIMYNIHSRLRNTKQRIPWHRHRQRQQRIWPYQGIPIKQIVQSSRILPPSQNRRRARHSRENKVIQTVGKLGRKECQETHLVARLNGGGMRQYGDVCIKLPRCLRV